MLFHKFFHQHDQIFQKHLTEVDNRNALSELLVYANRYRTPISQSIQSNTNLFDQFDSIFEQCEPTTSLKLVGRC